MSKEKRRLTKAQARTDEFFKKPDNRTIQEKIADMKTKREAAQSIGVDPGGKKRKK